MYRSCLVQCMRRFNRVGTGVTQSGILCGVGVCLLWCY